MGLMVDSTRMPFVGSLRFLASRAPDSTLVIFGLSFANRVLNFRRDGAEFVGAYHIELVLRRDSTFTRTISRDATVRVATAPETMRRDESVIFQQLLTVPPGVYNVMAVVRDLNSPAYARVDIVDTVPLFPAISLGGPLPLYDGKGRQKIDSQPAVVVNPRGMGRYGSDTLHFYVEGYGLPSGTRLLARVFDADSVVLWSDSVSLTSGAAMAAVAVADSRPGAGADAKGGKGARGARPGAEAGVAAAAGARAMFGAGAGDSALVRSGAGAAAGAAAGAGAQGVFGDAAAADADTSVRGAGAGMLGSDAATAAIGDVAAAGGAGGEAGAAARAGIRGLLGAGALAAAGGDSAKPAADTTAMRDSAAIASTPPAGGGGALAAMGFGAGSGVLAGAAGVSGRTGSGVAADADIGVRARGGAGPRGRGPELVPLMSATFAIPPGILPLGLQRLAVDAVGTKVHTETPFLVAFSEPWAVKTYSQIINLLRYYPRTDLVAKLKAAPKAERAKAWHDFLRESDPTPQTAQHDSLDAYFMRIDQANRRFLEPAGPGWRTERGEVYVSIGEPDQSYEVPGRKAPGVRWEYTTLKLTLSFADNEGNGQYHLTQQSRIDYERALAQVRGVH
jgi:GWxTD domain-containing protein